MTMRTSDSATTTFRPPPGVPPFRVYPVQSARWRPRVILGVSAFFHDSAAALVRDGEVVAAAQEDRFTRRNHDSRFPEEAVAFCLARAGIERHEVEAVAFYEEPVLKFDRLAQTLRGGRSFHASQASLERSISQLLDGQTQLRRAFDCPTVFVPHHVCHAATGFYLSPFSKAASLVIDGVGEWATTTLGMAQPEGIETLEEIRYPHSLGLLYSALTAYLGFAANTDEYKVMGLAAYGSPKYRQHFEELVKRHPDGSFELAAELVQPEIFEYLAYVFGHPARKADEPITEEHAAIAASLQETADQILVALLRRLRRTTGLDSVVLTGGVAMNGKASYRGFRESGFKDIYVPPAPGDSGSAVGAALLVSAALSGERSRRPTDLWNVGPTFSQEEVLRVLDAVGARYEQRPWNELLDVVAGALAEDKVVGWFQGAAELGPRALGARSILASPKTAEMVGRVNRTIKFRETFRPFAPAVPMEDAETFFDLESRLLPARYMLFVVPVRPAWRARIPAVVHVDGTARPHLVRQVESPRFHALLRAFEKRSGISVLLNTSFNITGEPMVCSPLDAWTSFLHSGIDLLVMEQCLIWKRENS